MSGTAQNCPMGVLAMSLAQHARSVGLTVVALRVSRMRHSRANHLRVRDARRRDWLLCVTDRPLAANTGHELPRFELVTRDGRTGSELAFGFLNRVSRGEVIWTAPKRTRGWKGMRR